MYLLFAFLTEFALWYDVIIGLWKVPGNADVVGLHDPQSSDEVVSTLFGDLKNEF